MLRLEIPSGRVAGAVPESLPRWPRRLRWLVRRGRPGGWYSTEVEDENSFFSVVRCDRCGPVEQEEDGIVFCFVS